MERISIRDVVGTDVRSRISLDAVKALMTHGGEYVIDMEGVSCITCNRIMAQYDLSIRRSLCNA